MQRVRNNLTLHSLADTWQGQQLFLVAQHNKISVRRPALHQNSYGYGPSRNSRAYKHTGKENYSGMPHSYASEQQFVYSPRGRAQKGRVSLADLGAVYSEMHSQADFRGKAEVKSEKKKAAHSFKYYSGNKKQHKNSNQIGQYEHDTHNYQQYGLRPSQNLNRDNYVEESIRSMVESIKEINLPKAYVYSAQYEEANHNFEKMKQKILGKIMKSGSDMKLEAIMQEIKKSAEQIIAKHYPASFKAESNFSFNNEVSHQESVIEPLALERISEEQEERNSRVVLPHLKDDGASLSSIKSDSATQKQVNRQQEEIHTSEKAQVKAIVQNQFSKREIASQAEPLPSDKGSIHQSREELGQQNMEGSSYYLEKITPVPVKIVSNLEEAQKFDSSVVKFTHLKARIIETRTLSPTIIRLRSSYTRKQEIVSKLVANQVVQKESSSIEQEV